MVFVGIQAALDPHFFNSLRVSIKEPYEKDYFFCRQRSYRVRPHDKVISSTVLVCTFSGKDLCNQLQIPESRPLNHRLKKLNEHRNYFVAFARLFDIDVRGA